MKTEIKFEIEQRVEIIELKRKGRVLAIFITKKGIEYQIRYFDNAEVKTIYFFEDELKEVY